MNPAADLKRTPLYDRHIALGARVVDFAGWAMPLNYPVGMVAEHLATRRFAGLFDVSHMGRFSIRGADALPFLRRLLTNDATTLAVGRSHYTLFASHTGGAVDDAYLCRFTQDEFLLIVNAANRQKDWDHLMAERGTLSVELTDLSSQLAMFSLQGPASQGLLSDLVSTGSLPDQRRNSLSITTLDKAEILIARTGYTGEPVCFELIASPDTTRHVWDLLVEKGATPTGLGARDTLRLEAALPLHGHEQGTDPDGQEIPLLSCPVALYGVNLSAERGDFIGKESLMRQREALGRNSTGDYSLLFDLPKTIRAVAVTGRGIARAGSVVKCDGREAGWITSGTMVPYWKRLATQTETTPGGQDTPGDEHDLRSICLAYLDSTVTPGDRVIIDVRGKSVAGMVVERHLRTDVPPFARPIVYQES